jgi:hypothetical protein
MARLCFAQTGFFMRRNFLSLLLVFFAFAAICRADDPQRPKRKDAFFGIHLDFHCSIDDHVGQNTTDEMVNALLDAVRPDFIQIDCKGHPGISSYPTKVGNPCSNITGDPLRVWRKVTAARGVSLYMHYSGVWDNRAIALHPEWAYVNADGSLNQRATSAFGGYLDELMIPQLKELALDYGVDGVWVDGDCWSAASDYGEASAKAFRERTGIDVLPKSKDEPNWAEWLEFNRDVFRNRLRYWVDEVHAAAPDFEITSNWAFTDHMPEPVSADIDYISGDYTPANSVNAARLTPRFISSQGKPWDLMAWSFARKEPNAPWQPKGTAQLMREAACVLSQGGGFQAYYFQNRDGSVDIPYVSQMGEIGEFCRARKPFCFRSVAVPQTIFVIPTASHYDRVNQAGAGLFPNVLTWQRGLCNAILDSQYSLDVALGETFKKCAAEYPAAVLCEWETLPPDLVDFVADYVCQGGHLFLTGEKLCALFGQAFQDVVWQTSDFDPLLVSGTFGSGLVVKYPRCFSAEYLASPNEETRQLVEAAMRLLLPEPAVTVEGSHHVDVSLRRSSDGLLGVHLVNVSGPHQTDPFFNDIQPIGPLTVRVKTEKAPESVTMQPAGTELPFRWEDGYVTVSVDQVDLYDIVVVK